MGASVWFRWKARQAGRWVPNLLRAGARSQEGTAVGMPNQFPSLNLRGILKILSHLGYEEIACKGSHRKLAKEGKPNITIAFHQGASIPPGVVRDILVKQAQLSMEEALEAVRHG
jgi:predicted RNA binding protein YcfA (HicA-like mRNA interferase family)